MCRRIFTFLSIFILCTCTRCQPGPAHQDEDIKGIEGGSTTLPCGSDHLYRLYSVQGENIEYDPFLWHAVPYHGIQLLDGSWVITNLSRKEDEGMYFCDVGDMMFKLTVLVPLTSAVLESSIGDAGNHTLDVVAESRTTIHCTVNENVNPKPDYEWFIERRKTINSPIPVLEQFQNGSAILMATRDMEGDVLKCRVNNSLGYMEDSVILSILYLEQPRDSIQRIIATEGESLSLACNMSGNPEPTITWQNDKDVRNKTYSIASIQRSQSGIYTCTAVNDQGNFSITWYLTVEYPPDVFVSFDPHSMLLTCMADGIPSSYTFYKWEHRLGGILIKTFVGNQSSAIYTANLSNYTYSDTGNYVCTVSNGISGKQTERVFIRPPSKAVFQWNQTTNFDVDSSKHDIAVYFYSHPAFTDIEWTNPHGVYLAKYPHSVDRANIPLLFYGRSVTVEGHVTILPGNLVTSSGVFIVSVENDEGRSILTIKLNLIAELNYIWIGLGITLVLFVCGIVWGVYRYKTHRTAASVDGKQRRTASTCSFTSVRSDYTDPRSAWRHGIGDTVSGEYEDVNIVEDNVDTAGARIDYLNPTAGPEASNYTSLDHQQVPDYEKLNIEHDEGPKRNSACFIC